MKHNETLALAGLLAVISLVMSACAPARTVPAIQINTVQFIAREYAYSGPDSIPSGTTRISLVNEGKEAHQIQLFKLEAGKTAHDF